MIYKKRMFSRFASLVLICTVLLAAMMPINSAQSGSIDANNAKIDELQRKAEQIARENREREERITELQEDVNQQQEYISEVDTQIKQIEAQISAYRELINAKQQSIDETAAEIERKELEINNTEERINQRQGEINRLEEENNENIKIFGDIVSQMYMNSQNDVLTMLTDSTGFYDVLVRAEMIRNIGIKNASFTEELLAAIKRQEDAISELEIEIAAHETEKAAFADRLSVFETELTHLNDERNAISAEVNSRYQALNDLTAERDEIQSRVDGLNTQVDNAIYEIENIEKRVAELEESNRRIEEEIRKAQDPDRPTYSTSGFIFPLDSQFKQITCGYGWDSWRNGMHTGVDFGSGGINGTSIYAVQSGTVIRVSDGGGWGGGYGNHIVIDHGGGVSTLYAHMQTGVSVSNGQFVEQGTVIGRVGNTGWSTGPHLHFEVRINGTAVDPTGYI